MLSGLSYQPAACYASIASVAWKCLLSLRALFFTAVSSVLYIVLSSSSVVHPCPALHYTGSSSPSPSPSSSPSPISFHVSVEIHSLSSFFFLPNTVMQVSFHISFTDFQWSSTQVSSGMLLDISHFVLMADCREDVLCSFVLEFSFCSGC
ncbi:unnamed protein product [Heterobilharzia americana]|nr:unnamed protein product [Heterobilharzia americana]